MADLVCANTTFAEFKAKCASAVSGDRVLVPSGTVTFTSCVSSQDPFSSGEDVTLQNKSITIEGGYGGGTTTFQDACNKSAAYPDRPEMIYWNTISTGSCVLKKITFQGNVSADPNNKGMVRMLGTNPNLRITECTFIGTTGSPISIDGSCYGVMDHCTFDSSDVQISMYVKNGQTSSDQYGDSSWSSPSTVGGSENFFIEDCTFTNDRSVQDMRWAVDGWKGSRMVFRHNILNNCIVGNHGTESSGRERSMRHCEVYDNTFSATLASNFPDVVGLRGGTAVIFNNTVTIGGSTITRFGSFNNYRSDPDKQFYPWGWSGRFTPTSITRSGTTATITFPVIFGGFGTNHGFYTTDHYVRIEGATDNLYNGTYRVTGVTATTVTYTMGGTPAANASGTLVVTSPWDGNSDVYGYRCLDQGGAGQGANLNGVEIPVPVTMSQALEPIYVWNNTHNGGAGAFAITGTNAIQAIQLNRDYYLSAKPGYTAYTYPHPLNGGGGGGGGGGTPGESLMSGIVI